MKLKDFLTPVNVDQLDFSSTIIIHQRSKTLDEMEFDCCREEIEIIGRVRCDGTLSHVAATQGGGGADRLQAIRVMNSSADTR